MNKAYFQVSRSIKRLRLFVAAAILLLAGYGVRGERVNFFESSFFEYDIQQKHFYIYPIFTIVCEWKINAISWFLRAEIDDFEITLPTLKFVNACLTTQIETTIWSPMSNNRRHVSVPRIQKNIEWKWASIYNFGPHGIPWKFKKKKIPTLLSLLCLFRFFSDFRSPTIRMEMVLWRKKSFFSERGINGTWCAQRQLKQQQRVRVNKWKLFWQRILIQNYFIGAAALLLPTGSGIRSRIFAQNKNKMWEFCSKVVCNNLR